MPLAEAAAKLAAEHILQRRRQPLTPIGQLPASCQPADLQDSMAIQDVLNDLLSQDGHGTVIGTKIGCTTKVMQDYLGMPHPCAGAIFDSTVRRVDGEFAFSTFLHVGVECEIAVKLHSEIAAAGAPHTVPSVSACVHEMFPAIEIVDDRYEDLVARVPDWRTWLADNFFGAGIVLGDPVTEWHELDLSAIRGVMRINGSEVGAGHGRDIINGHPLEALRWLANSEAARGRDIPSGWVVMLGSVVQTKWVAKGDVVDIEMPGLGNVRARFT